MDTSTGSSESTLPAIIPTTADHTVDESNATSAPAGLVQTPTESADMSNDIQAASSAMEDASPPSSSSTYFRDKLARWKQEIMDVDSYKKHMSGLFELLDIGCCPACAFRFSNYRHLPLYQQRPELLRQLIGFLRSESIPEFVHESSFPPCVACFGILPMSCNERFQSDLCGAIRKSGYSFKEYRLTVNLPTSTVVRQYSLWYHLQAKFGQSFYENSSPTCVDIKEAMKWVLGPILGRRLHVQFKHDAKFHADLTFEHPETVQEPAPFIESASAKSRKKWRGFKNNKKQAEPELDSLALVTATLDSGTADKFRKVGHIPPQPTTTTATYQLTFEHSSVFIGGRYTKLAGDLPQTPWTAEDPTSVQKYINDVLASYFPCDEMKFSSSGREDRDVRMSGSGRPFVIELINPRKQFYPAQKYREMEQQMKAVPDSIVVTKLRDVSKKEVAELRKAGQASKRKQYRCAVWIQKPVSDSDLAFLREIKDLTIDQKTPVRVLQRRVQAVRKKTIHSMTYNVIDEHNIQLDLWAAGGTYIKEFIHGDLGRTVPNLGILLDCDADILCLEVLEVDVDFPKQR